MTLEERVELVYYAERDPTAQEAFLKMIDDPVEGDVFFINTCCMTYDPRNSPSGGTIGAVPFLLWGAQEDFAREVGRCIDNEGFLPLGQDVGVEKSRDMGVTWLILCLIARRYLRRTRFNALIGAMTENLCDDPKDPASLGWKLDFVLEHLPGFVKPKTPSSAGNKEFRSWMNWVNPETLSTITGRAPTPRFAVGDRKSVIYFDDWAQWEHGLSAWENAAATSSCRLASWTVNRDAPLNHAYQLAKGKGSFENVAVNMCSLHWSSDPRKASMACDLRTKAEYNVWKREQIGEPTLGIPGRISLQQFLRDYEMKYEIAAKGLIYSKHLPYARVGKFPHDPRFPLFTTWDYGKTDDTVILWWQYDFEACRLRIIDMVSRAGFVIGYYVPFVLGRKDASEQLEFEHEYTDDDWKVIVRHETWQRYNPHLGIRAVQYTDHFGDPAGKQSGISASQSAVEVLADSGIYVKDKDNNRDKSFRGRIDSAREILPFVDIDSELCASLITSLQYYKWNAQGTAPEHDQYSHAAASFEYGAVNLLADFKTWVTARHKAEAMQRAGMTPAIFGGHGLNISPGQWIGGGDVRAEIDYRSYSGGRDIETADSMTGY